jgi:hypothetical protein
VVHNFFAPAYRRQVFAEKKEKNNKSRKAGKAQRTPAGSLDFFLAT